MEKEIEVAVNYERVVSKKINVDLPETEKYYAKNDDGNFFPRGVVLFAIIPMYKENPTSSYTLIEVEASKQNCTDFVPTKDCRQTYWLSDTSGIRRTAFNIITKADYEFKEITKEQFDKKRIELLNDYQQND